MKKLLSFVLVCCAIVSSLAGCGNQPKNEATSPVEGSVDASSASEQPLKGKKIGYICAGPDELYAVNYETSKYFIEKAGGEVIYATSDYNETTELDNMQNMIVAGCDAIILNCVNSNTAKETCKIANNEGVPLFCVCARPNGEYDYNGVVFDSWYNYGHVMGAYAAENWPDAVMITIDGMLTQNPGILFRDGFMDGVEEAGLTRPVSLGDGGWSKDGGLQLTQDLIASGRDFDVLFCANEEEAAGAIQALQEANITDKIVLSINGKEAGVKMIEDGTLTATMSNPPTIQGDVIVQMVLAYFAGEEYCDYIEVYQDGVITKDTVSKAVPWDIEAYAAGREANAFEWSLDYYGSLMNN